MYSNVKRDVIMQTVPIITKGPRILYAFECLLFTKICNLSRPRRKLWNMWCWNGTANIWTAL